MDIIRVDIVAFSSVETLDVVATGPMLPVGDLLARTEPNSFLHDGVF